MNKITIKSLQLATILVSFDLRASGTESIEMSVGCAVAVTTAITHFQKNHDKLIDRGEFGQVACIERDGGMIEIVFDQKNPQVRGGGVHYEISSDGQKIQKIRHTR